MAPRFNQMHCDFCMFPRYNRALASVLSNFVTNPRVLCSSLYLAALFLNLNVSINIFIGAYHVYTLIEMGARPDDFLLVFLCGEASFRF